MSAALFDCCLEPAEFCDAQENAGGGNLSETLKALGIVSRPSLDGIDLAIIETDGDAFIAPGPSMHLPHNREMKIILRRAIKAAREGRDGAADIGKAAGESTAAFVGAVERLLERENIKRKDIDVIGVGGHTILHRAPSGADAPGRSWQIGDGGTIAEETRIDVVSDFRAADIAAGGYGAPIDPVYIRALIASMADRPECAVGVINLGETVRVTYAPENASASDLLAYDSGPGVSFLNEWATARALDERAPTGSINEEALRMMGLHPYLRLPPPKSIDRYDFNLDHLLKLTPEDGAATLTAFVADCVARTERYLPEPPGGYIICGEGARRSALMATLRDRLEAEVATAEDAGWRDDVLDAECFAFLGVRSLKKLPLTYPKTTRVSAPTLGGVFSRAPV